MYPEAGLVPEAPGAPFPWLDICRSWMFNVAELSHCSADAHRKVIETILMFTWGKHVWSPGGRSHSESKQAVMWRRSSKTWLPAIPSRIFTVRFRKPALASNVCAMLAMRMQRATGGEGRILLRASPKVCHILLDKSCDLPTLKTICQVKNSSISNSLLFRTWQNKKRQ